MIKWGQIKSSVWHLTLVIGHTEQRNFLGCGVFFVDGGRDITWVGGIKSAQLLSILEYTLNFWTKLTNVAIKWPNFGFQKQKLINYQM